jgi:hypothetical protein
MRNGCLGLIVRVDDDVVQPGHGRSSYDEHAGPVVQQMVSIQRLRMGNAALGAERADLKPRLVGLAEFVEASVVEGQRSAAPCLPLAGDAAVNHARGRRHDSIYQIVEYGAN